MVLPTLVKNVIKVNAQYRCDYYVHYSNATVDIKRQPGEQGEIQADEIQMLTDAIRKVTQRRRLPVPNINYQSITDTEFESMYKDLLQKVRDGKDNNGKLKDSPQKQTNLDYPESPDDTLKSWHTIQSAWNLMKEGETKYKKKYTRVAMMRLDVLYMTPIDIIRVNTTLVDTRNKYTVIPWFGSPINDRLVYGPAKAVEIWSTQRFSQIDDHVARINKIKRGKGIQPERFVKYNLLPRMEKVSTVDRHNDICFLRVKADGLVWVSDCENEVGESREQDGQKRHEIEVLTGRKCGKVTDNLESSRVMNCTAQDKNKDQSAETK
jgi:hypothetical protein